LYFLIGKNLFFDILIMNRVILWTLVGIVVSSISSVSVAAIEMTTTTSSQSSSGTELNQITDPYEQCLAYAKLKQIDGVDCKARIGWNSNTGGTGSINQSGWAELPPPGVTPKPPVKESPLSEMTLAEIIKIKNPLEQCLAYVNLKKITGVDCKIKAKAIESANSQKKDGKILNQTGSTQTEWVLPPKSPRPPVTSPTKETSGQIGESEIQSLIGAIEKLSPADRLALTKIIQDFLKSKNTKTPIKTIVLEKKIATNNTQVQQKGETKPERDTQSTLNSQTNTSGTIAN
jgi:hypothetical protein